MGREGPLGGFYAGGYGYRGTVTTSTRGCMRCSAPAEWLVVNPYEPSRAPTGRLLLYCDPCRAEHPNGFTTVLPAAVLDGHADAALSLLYAAGLTASDPDIIRDTLGVPTGPWFAIAKQHTAH